MIQAARRFAVPAALLALAAALPVWFHSLDDPTHDPCRDPGRLFSTPRIGSGVVAEVLTAGDEPGAGSIEGVIEDSASDFRPIAFRIERTFEPTRLYGSAALFKVDPTFALDGAGELREIELGKERVPVHWLEDTFGLNYRVRAHTFMLGGKPVDSPFAAGVRLALPQLVTGTLPVTMFAVRAEGRRVDAEVMQESVREWLEAALSLYRLMCGLE